MLTNILAELFERDFSKLKNELTSYKNEANIWKTAGQVSNSAGNLTLHICGSLKHFIGAVLGNSGYVRDREKEFKGEPVELKYLLQNIDETIDTIKNTLSKINTADLEKAFPANVFNGEKTTEFFLVHLVSHVNYHLGQVNYHRRLIEG